MSTSNIKKISQDWTSFCQSFDIDSSKTIAFKLQGTVKAKIDSDKGSASLWVRVDNKDGSKGFFDNMMDCPIQSNYWKTFTIKGMINEASAKISFGGFCLNYGDFYFKNFQLFIENKSGDLEKIEIVNPDFKEVTHQLSIPGWKQGTGREEPKEVIEYIFRSIYSGKKTSYLKIKGSRVFDLRNKYTDEIGTLIFMLQSVGKRMIKAIQELSVQEIDYLPDDKINSIGALIMHILATETYYHVYTFENRGFNQEENEKWKDALELGEKTQRLYKDLTIDYYLDAYYEVRQKTIQEFEKLNDKWLKITPPKSVQNNHHNWLHVMEHQSYHLGQIVMLKKLMY
ncbi:DinB family protein [uncultured Aquimarina sp.]|uniref:DinB family protein n=1 Tax=uncultured Aquimarina sp. TaxID=575652 RepID=UPI00262ACA99|nr:DinB family protein [uncultured Aquimarina sp.]